MLTDRLLKNWEERIVTWLIPARYKVFISAIVILLVVLLSKSPYLNLYVGKDLIIFLIISSLIIIFNINLKKIIIMSFIPLILSLILIEIGNLEDAELMADYMYGFLLIGMTKFIFNI